VRPIAARRGVPLPSSLVVTIMTDPVAPQPELADERVEAPITDAELHALLLRARAEEDAPLRRLVTSYVTLRRVTADVIVFIEQREGGSTVAGTPLLRRARELADAPRR